MSEEGMNKGSEAGDEGIPTAVEKLHQLNKVEALKDSQHAQTEPFQIKHLSETIIDSLPGIFCILNKEGDLFRWNSKFKEVTGYSSNELGVMQGNQLIYSDNKRKVQDWLKEIFGNGKQIDIEMSLITKNGNKIPYRFTGNQIIIESKPYAIVTGINITAQKTAEDMLKESEERYRSFFENSTDFRYTLDLNGNFISVNKAAERLTGYTRAELTKMNFKDYTSKDDHEKIFSAFQRVFMTGEFLQDFPIEVTVKDNVKKYFETSVARLQSGDEIIGFQGSSRDITERKHAEDALRESEERFKTLFQSAPDAYYLMDMEGYVMDANEAALNLLGYSKDEIIGKHFLEINVFPSWQLEKVREFLGFSREVRFFGPEYITAIRKDGRQVEVEAMSHIIKFRGQKYLLGIARDISERKRLEAQLFQAQKMESIGTLAGGIAHNFNNLLMGIQGNATIMLLNTDSNHAYFKNLKNIEALIKNGAKLTNQLLEYAREGRFEIMPLDLNCLVKDTTDTFGAAKKDIKIHFTLSNELYPIKADQGQIEQTLMSLFVNAADAMPKGGDLFIETTNVTHQDMQNKPYHPKPGDYIKLSIRDTGVGMDEKTMERMFEPFFTTKGLAKGTGLGLASAYGVIKGHGGYIDVDSKKGHGTTFNIYLPVTKQKTFEQGKISDGILKGAETILFVDDEKMVLDTSKQMLEKLGYQVFVAISGKEALEIIEKNPGKINMAVLDMIMPNMGGGETYDKMKEMDPTIKVLLSSGYSVDGQATDILNRGCDGFIQKPFDINDLSQKIRQILDL